MEFERPGEGIEGTTEKIHQSKAVLTFVILFVAYFGVPVWLVCSTELMVSYEDFLV